MKHELWCAVFGRCLWIPALTLSACVDDLVVGTRAPLATVDAEAPGLLDGDVVFDAAAQDENQSDAAGEHDAALTASDGGKPDATPTAPPPKRLGPCRSCDVVLRISPEMRCDDGGLPQACWENEDGSCSMQCPAVKRCEPGLPDSCGGDAYCFFPNYDCGEDSAGFCAPRPESCTPQGGMVCGCDGVRYDSTCAAERSGTPFLAHGPCPEVKP